MWNELVGQYLESADGGELLKQLQGKGLSEQQATQAVTATAESASGSPGRGMVLSHVTGGLLASLKGAPSTGAAPGGATGAANTIAQVVAQRTGLTLPMAQTVVSMVLPKVMSLFSGAQASAPRAPSALGGILGMLR